MAFFRVRSRAAALATAALMLILATMLLAWAYVALDAALSPAAPACGVPASPPHRPTVLHGLAFREVQP